MLLDEIAHAANEADAWRATGAQIRYKAWVTEGGFAEGGRAHARTHEEALYLGQEFRDCCVHRTII